MTLDQLAAQARAKAQDFTAQADSLQAQVDDLRAQAAAHTNAAAALDGLAPEHKAVLDPLSV